MVRNIPGNKQNSPIRDVIVLSVCRRPAAFFSPLESIGPGALTVLTLAIMKLTFAFAAGCFRPGEDY